VFESLRLPDLLGLTSVLVAFSAKISTQTTVTTRVIAAAVTVCSYMHVLTHTASSELYMYLGLRDAGVSVQLTVVPVGFTVTATHPVVGLVTQLQRKENAVDAGEELFR